jgi:hypothetical protein
MTEAEPLLTSDGAEVRMNLYIQDSRALYKVSTVYPDRVTVTVCFDVNGQPLPRTTVRTLTPGQVAAMPVASTRIIGRYHAFLDGERS